MSRYFDIKKEMEYENDIIVNLSYQDKYELTNKLIERLVLIREFYKDFSGNNKKTYTKYCKRIVRLRYINMYYEKQAFITELRLKYNKRSVNYEN